MSQLTKKIFHEKLNSSCQCTDRVKGARKGRDGRKRSIWRVAPGWWNGKAGVIDIVQGDLRVMLLSDDEVSPPEWFGHRD
ncbi:hypothetical protein CLAIMM_01399 [Cladophialophora immunda]|nr:hypothetical protein CLAIMM_01399 [Cladophialophora immunda]